MVPYYHFKRPLSQMETFSEWTDNKSLLAGVEAIATGDEETWERVKDVFEVIRVADVGEPGEERLRYIRELIIKLENNKSILRNNLSFTKLIEFFASTTGQDLLDGALSNADGGHQNRICVEKYINEYINYALIGDKSDHFTSSPEHKKWKLMGRKYTDFRELYGKFYNQIKVRRYGELKDFCIFAKFFIVNNKMQRNIDKLEDGIEQQ